MGKWVHFLFDGVRDKYGFGRSSIVPYPFSHSETLKQKYPLSQIFLFLFVILPNGFGVCIIRGGVAHHQVRVVFRFG
jgi:hypothetical protein